MRHPYVVIVAGLLGLFLASFAVVEALEVPLLTDPGPWLDAPGLLAAIVAGTSRLRLGPALLAGAVGNLVPAAAYAVTAAVAASFVNQTAVFLLVVAVAVLFWFAARRAEDRLVVAAAGDRVSGA